MSGYSLSDPVSSYIIKHPAEEQLERIDIDQDGDQHRPADQDRHAIFETETPAPEPMAPPKDAQHRYARDKCRHILERDQERLDIIRHLTRGDYQHSHCESERRIDECLQASHLDSAESKPLQPGKRIEVRGKRGRYFLFVLIHAAKFTRASEVLGASFSTLFVRPIAFWFEANWQDHPRAAVS